MSEELTDADRELLQGETFAATPPVETIGIVIAGMHRSGTSALVRVLNLLGVDLPNELHPARPDNPYGYWEPRQVVEAHEEFLTTIGSSFDDVSALPSEALRGEAAQALEDRLVEILETEFSGSPEFVVKDPRLCRLVPIWIAALERFGASPRFILPIRNPLEVAASLKIRNEYGTTKSLMLWLRHILEAERHTRGFGRSIVTYEQLLRDWVGTVERIAQDLRVVWPHTSHSAHAEVEQFLSPRGRHHSFQLDELRARADVVDWVKTGYEIFVAAAEGEQLEEDVLDTLRGELDRADRAFGPLLAELRLSQRSQQKALSEQAAELAEATTEVERLTAELARGEQERANEAARGEQERANAATRIGQLEQRVQALVEEAAEIQASLTASDGRLATTRAALTESRLQCGQLTRELASGAEAAAALRATLDALEKKGESTQAALRDTRAELATAESRLDAAAKDIDRLVRGLAERETAMAARIEAARHDAETISSLQARVAELERRRINLRGSSRRGPWRKSSVRSRYRSATQFTSWLLRPSSGGWEHVSTYLTLRRSGQFDAEAYFAAYHDVRDSGTNPLMHYVEHGRREGRSPFGLEPAAVAATPSWAAGELPAPPPAPHPPSPGMGEGAATSATATRTRGVDFSDFVVLFARQRSGTNPLRWLLTAHEDITCFSEIFSVLDRDSDRRDFEDRSLRDMNFLNFAAEKDPNWSQPGVADHRELFLDFLEYLRCFTDKRYAVLDIKYNTTHLLAEPWARNFGSPLLFDIIVEQDIKVINVTRKNHLRFLLSNQKALESGAWHVWGERAAAYQDRPVRIDCTELLDELRIRSDEDAAVRRRFEGYPGYRAFEYTEIFGDDGRLAPEFARSLTEFLDIPDRWKPNNADGTHRQLFSRQSSLPLAEAIENYDEVADTLSGTEFESLLLDEPRFRTS